jgi:signal transduction histidine kinase/CheY-like chemotaxis protein/PAS domain-containing protein
LFFGPFAIASLFIPIQLSPNIFINSSGLTVLIATLFGGKRAGIITSIFVIILNIFQGGEWTFSECSNTAFSFLLGIIFTSTTKNKENVRYYHLLVLIIVSSLLYLTSMLMLPIPIDNLEVVWTSALPVFILFSLLIFSTIPLIIHEVKEIKKQNKLKENERFLSIAEHINGTGSWQWNLNTNELRWSDEFYRVLGLKPGSIRPSLKAYWKFIHKKERDKFKDDFKKFFIKTNFMLKSHHRVILQDQSINYMFIKSKVINHNKDGSPKVVIGVIDNMTKYIQLEKEKEKNLQIRMILNSVLKKSLENQPLQNQLNDSLEIILSLPLDNFSNKGAISIFDNETEKFILIAHKNLDIETINEIKKNGQYNPLQYCHSHPIGEKNSHFAGNFNEKLYTVPISHHNKLIGVLNLYLKANSHQSPNEEIIIGEISDNLANIIKEKQTHQQLIKEKEKAELANKVKDNFLSLINHELRTPLNSILGSIEILKETSLDENQLSLLQVQEKSGNALLQLIDDIIDISLYDSLPSDLSHIQFSLKDLIETIFSSMKFKAESKDLSINLDIDDSIPNTTYSDPRRIRQIILNILGNAIKFTEKGQVDIIVKKFEKNQNKIHIMIKDTGIGILKGDIENIFEPFQQGSNIGSKVTKGAGIGLSIANKLSQSIEGDLRAISTPNEGTTFHFLFPNELYTIPNTVTNGKPIIISKQKVSSFEKESLNILYAEDNDENFEIIKYFLQSQNHTVTIARDGEEAIAKVKKYSFDLILMDIKMPKINGLQAIIEIRKFEKDNDKKPIPIIALSTQNQEEKIQEILNSGCNEYLIKPVKKEKLFNVLKKFFPSKNIFTT